MSGGLLVINDRKRKSANRKCQLRTTWTTRLNSPVFSWKNFKKSSFSKYESGTPLMRKIMENHKLMVDFHQYFLEGLLSFQRILGSHLTHSLDFMDLEELEWNRTILKDIVRKFQLTSECYEFARIVLEEMISLRNSGRPVFKTLVDTENRRKDKRAIEDEHGLTEQGLLDLNIYSKSQPNLQIASGYYRMLYGDHGPYIEFVHKQIMWNAFPNVDRRGVHAYFDYYYSEDRSIRLYYQRRDVKNKPNPPYLFGARRAENNRPEGYADYVTGRYYADANDVNVRSDTYISLLRKIRRAEKIST